MELATLSADQLLGYFARIRVPSLVEHSRTPKPTLKTLGSLHRGHVQNIPFENFTLRHPRLQALHGSQVYAYLLCCVTVELNQQALYRKLVTNHRGGYCFEMNGLMASVLHTCGYTLKLGAGRVVRGPDEAAPLGKGDSSDRPVTLGGHDHMVLFVQVEDGIWWLEDVGFGGRCIRRPLPLVAYHSPAGQGLMEADPQLFATHRLRRGVPGTSRIPTEERLRDDPMSCGWYMQAKTSSGFQDQYFFFQQEHPLEDHTIMNWYIATHPDSYFRNNTLAAIQTADGSVTLNNGKLTVHAAEGVIEDRELYDDGELDGALMQYFGVPFE